MQAVQVCPLNGRLSSQKQTGTRSVCGRDAAVPQRGYGVAKLAIKGRDWRRSGRRGEEKKTPVTRWGSVGSRTGKPSR